MTTERESIQDIGSGIGQMNGRSRLSEEEIIFTPACEGEFQPNGEETASASANSEELPRWKRKHAQYLKNKRRIELLIEEGDASATYPQDCYSFISLSGPGELIFWFGVMVFAFQMIFLVLALLSIVKTRWNTGKIDDNPAESLWSDLFATEVGPILRATQIMTLVTSVIFVDSSVSDIITGIQTFPNFKIATDNDRVGSMIFSCILRIIQGTFALVVSLILVFNSNNVIEVILNFTALNFISALDDVFFEFSGSGKYGPYLEKKVKQIEDLRLPVCMYRKYKHLRFFVTFAPILVIVLSFGITVIRYQEHSKLWETNVFRVQFQEDGLEYYNGCYYNDFKRNDGPWKRDFYVLYDSEGKPFAEFGFCIDEQIWVLYNRNQSPADGSPAKDVALADDFSPCDIYSEDKAEAFSSDTDAFDITTLFNEGWFRGKGTPLELYFFGEFQDDRELFCDAKLGNGVCDDFFNTEAFDYDHGDCCAATCLPTSCGLDQLKNAFNVNATGDGYPKCKDELSMKAYTIQLDSFTNSRDLYYDGRIRLSKENQTHIKRYVPDYYEVTPDDVLLTLYCDGIKVLKVYINPDMKNKTETVWIPPDADCILRMDNRTGTQPDFLDDPIWYVNYTVYPVDEREVSRAPVVISTSNYEVEAYDFEPFPYCYKETINHYNPNLVNFTREISDVHLKALRMIVSATESQSSKCPEDFIGKFALTLLYLAAPSLSGEQSDPSSSWVENEKPICEWSEILCVGPYTGDFSQDYINLDISGLGLSGSIPSEIGILDTLTLYDASKNQLKGSIPTEIGELTSLTLLKLGDNALSGPIPSEIGYLSTSLQEMFMARNKLSGSIPTEIGLLENLVDLSIRENELTGSIPSEIGLLTSLTLLRLAQNNLTDTIPSEIQKMKHLRVFNIKENGITGPLPTEIGLLTSMRRLTLDGNDVTGSIPSEIGYLTMMTRLDIDRTNFIGGMPTEFEKLTNLRVIYMDDVNPTLKDSVPESMKDKIANYCPLCDDLGFDDSNANQTCFNLIEEWESYNNSRTAIGECRLLREFTCLKCNGKAINLEEDKRAREGLGGDMDEGDQKKEAKVEVEVENEAEDEGEGDKETEDKGDGDNGDNGDWEEEWTEEQNEEYWSHIIVPPVAPIP